jgi:hypothetical protein
VVITNQVVAQVDVSAMFAGPQVDSLYTEFECMFIFQTNSM